MRKFSSNIRRVSATQKMMFQQVSVAETLLTLHSQIDSACLNYSLAKFISFSKFQSTVKNLGQPSVKLAEIQSLSSQKLCSNHICIFCTSISTTLKDIFHTLVAWLLEFWCFGLYSLILFKYNEMTSHLCRNFWCLHCSVWDFVSRGSATILALLKIHVGTFWLGFSLEFWSCLYSLNLVHLLPWLPSSVERFPETFQDWFVN